MKYNFKGAYMSAREFANGLWYRVRPVIAYIVGAVMLVLLTAWFTGSAAASSFDKIIDARIDSRINDRIANEVIPILKDISAKLDLSLDVQYTEQVRQINKTVEALKKDPEDVKNENVKVILERWNALPDTYKTDEVKIKYEVIRKWYEDSVK